jgi:hypothetical protein
MVRAKAARKFYAARVRQIRRRGITFSIRFDSATTALALALLGRAARAAAESLAGFGGAADDAVDAARYFRSAFEQHPAINGECTRLHHGGVATAPESMPVFPSSGPEEFRTLEPGRLYMGARDGGKRFLGTTGPVRLRLGHDPLPGQICGCTCTVTRTQKTDSNGHIRVVEMRSPPCDWCLDLEDRAAGEGFGLVLPPYCGTCGEPIEADELTGTTCACARRLLG